MPEEIAPPEEVELPTPPPVDPETAGPDAVKTAPDGRKVGWQQPPRPLGVGVPIPTDICHHTGAAIARMDIARRDLGNEWVCSCGQTFVVKIGGGGNKILVQKEVVPDESEEE